MNYVYYVQYHLDRQLHNVRDYAHAHGVTLKGDIPIGISRTSADAWTNPRLFNLNSQAGAPPDDFSVLGQNWGLPTYNWEEMSRDGFKWWKDRECQRIRRQNSEIRGTTHIIRYALHRPMIWTA